jgi:RNA polymerase sigma-70 factor (ECF subfamily)
LAVDRSSESQSFSAVALAPGGRVIPDASALLVERARRGDRTAFEGLVDLYHDGAVRTAMAILGDESDACDAIQDAFLGAWRGLPALRDSERFEAWWKQILVNSCRAIGRRRRRATVREIPMDALDASHEPADDGPWKIEANGPSLEEIERAFGRLSIDERSILVLHHLERHSVVEIAAVLGIPVGTAKSRLFNARRSLERALGAQVR